MLIAQVPDDEPDVPRWMVAAVTYRLHVVGLAGVKDELEYRFQEGENHTMIGNLVATLKQRLILYQSHRDTDARARCPCEPLVGRTRGAPAPRAA